MTKTGAFCVSLILVLAAATSFAEEGEKSAETAKDGERVGEVAGASEEGCSKVYSGSLASQTKDAPTSKAKKVAVDAKATAKSAK